MVKVKPSGWNTEISKNKSAKKSKSTISSWGQPLKLTKNEV